MLIFANNFCEMKKIIASLLLKILGWKIVLEGEESNLDRCILVVAPHTSNWEYIFGNLAYWKLGKNLRIIIKDKHTKSWYGGIIKSLGGIGINRSQRNNLVQFVAELFRMEDFSLVITPEGTRSKVDKWRLGFYHMALSSRVPIVLAAGDFKKKTIHLGKKISVRDLEERSMEDVLEEIQEYYKDKTPKFPEKWNPQIY